MRKMCDLVCLLMDHQDLLVEAHTIGLDTGLFRAEEAKVRRALMEAELIGRDGRFTSDRLKAAIRAVCQDDQPIAALGQDEWKAIARSFLAA